MSSAGLPQGTVPKLERPGPLRERVHGAPQRLNTEGWADLRPAQSAFVHGPTGEEADQLLSVRTLLEAEAGAARPAAAHTGRPGSEELEELCSEGERVAAAEDVDLTVATNAAFHAEVMELAGDVVLSELATQVDRRVRWYRTPVARRRGTRSWTEHRELIVASASGDEQRATEVMRAHTEHTRRTYRSRERT
ncbi:MAG TPA: FCD domain-containing protein [Streptomyces sp.]|uniref:FCD domain-containing protein n=1 Tax=Streptomyces sp. TaxID=1931 RepID=UPI002C52329F|nr:FCD domain-containing protein [Streptomyces sp.]HWU12279.1 FCD domain-containing protein [Streptomyces sp.]